MTTKGTVRLEEFVYLGHHLFYAEADGIAFLVEGGDLRLRGVRGGDQGIELLLDRGELLAEIGGFGVGGCASFALTADDFDGAQYLLFERLELVGADAGCDGCCLIQG
jgi:hypothetical protein